MLSKQRYKVLLIQPESEIAKEIMFWLHDSCVVFHAKTNEQATEQVTVNFWDLVITDSLSLQLDDLEITALVKQANPHTSVLIIAENIKVDFIITAMQNHADSLVFKPLNKEEFLDKALKLAEQALIKKKKDQKVVLAIGAHPDDVEIGCYGTMAKYLGEGALINIATLSSGGEGGNPKIRSEEANTAASMQSATLFLGNFVDTEIMSTAKTIKFLEEILDKVKPTHVYTHSFYDSHQDHRNVYLATLTACRQVPNIYSYFSPSSTVEFKPNLFININQYMEKKLECIQAFSSQITIRPYLQPDMIKATARYWGRFCNYQLAEPMEIIKEQHP